MSKTTEEPFFQYALQAVTRAEDNASGDHPRPGFYWPLLATAAVHALLAIAQAIECQQDAIIEALPMAGKGN